MAVDEKNSELKAQLEKQAAAYRKPAGERANKPGLPSPNNQTLPRGSSKNIHAGSRVIHWGTGTGKQIEFQPDDDLTADPCLGVAAANKSLSASQKRNEHPDHLFSLRCNISHG